MGAFFRIFFRILAPERGFYWMATIYGAGISLLSLATPISVQMLINTVANTALATPLLVLSFTLFGLLMISGLLNGLRVHLMELFGRRFYARLVSEISIRTVFAQNPFFEDTARGSLFNRYFDIVIVQKTVPYLLIGGFTVILQAGVGMVLVSLYHPLFLAFNLIIILLIWAIWLIWGASAIRSGIELSHRKHETAAWLESIGTSNGFFKSERRVEYALTETDAYTARYVNQHRRHFRRHFAQTLSFLFLYALASAVLLGLGGWLVIQGELTLGQLVAAELVLSAAFFGVSQLGGYLVYFYDLCASLEELSLFEDIDLEAPDTANLPIGPDATVAFASVKGTGRCGDILFNLQIPGGSHLLADASDYSVQRYFTQLLKRLDRPEGGYVTLGGTDLQDLDVQRLRQDVFVIERPSLLPMTIREYLRLSSDEVAASRSLAVLERVGLKEVIARFPDGLDTTLSQSGWPLSLAEAMLLKLAAAIIARPRILILSQLYDMVDEDVLEAALAPFANDPDMTLIYFTKRRTTLGFSRYLYLGDQEQFIYDRYEEFADFALKDAKRPDLPSDRPHQSITMIRE